MQKINFFIDDTLGEVDVFFWLQGEVDVVSYNFFVPQFNQ